MRGLFYANYFNLVINLFTSFGYFKNKHEDQKVLKSVANALKPGGVFILDYFNAEVALKNLAAAEEKSVCDINFSIKKKIENGFITKDISFSDKGKNYNYKEEVRAYTLPDFENLAASAGLKIAETFGDYKLGAFDKAVSERLIITFVK